MGGRSLFDSRITLVLIYTIMDVRLDRQLGEEAEIELEDAFRISDLWLILKKIQDSSPLQAFVFYSIRLFSHFRNLQQTCFPPNSILV